MRTATSRSINVVGDQPTQVSLLASDANGDPLTFEFTSSATHGLTRDFNPVSGVLTYVPARGYRGSDAFSFRASDSRASSATVSLFLNVLAPPDANDNGLPDAWESAYGISDPDADQDGDGQSNLAEYVANTNPTNATSQLKIDSALFATGGGFNLIWPSIGGTRYRVQFADDLANGAFVDVIRPLNIEMDPGAYGSASTQSFTDTFTQTGPPTNNARYYRVKVVP
jgi:hypothetical protein